MSIGGERFSGVVTPNAIHDALIAVGTGSFVILEAGPETYIQTASRDGAYIVEKRDGGSFEHFRALRSNDNLRLAERNNDLFDFEEVREVRSEEHTSELQSLMRISYAVFCLQNKKTKTQIKCSY